MVNMKKSEDKSPAIEAMGEIEPPEYPCGLCITLNEDSISKLGLSDLPGIGEKINIKAMCEVTSVSQYDSKGGKKERTLSLQITDMEVVKKKEVSAEAFYPTEKTVTQKG